MSLIFYDDDLTWYDDDLTWYDDNFVDPVIILPESGVYYSNQLISMSTATGGAAIYYTIDGSTPDVTDTLYTVPFLLVASKTIKAIGTKGGLDDSGVATKIYTVSTNQPIITIQT